MNLSYDRRITLLAIAAGFPPVVASLVLPWFGDYSWLTRSSLAIVLLGAWIGLVIACLLTGRFGEQPADAGGGDEIGQPVRFRARYR